MSCEKGKAIGEAVLSYMYMDIMALGTLKHTRAFADGVENSPQPVGWPFESWDADHAIMSMAPDKCCDRVRGGRCKDRLVVSSDAQALSRSSRCEDNEIETEFHHGQGGRSGRAKGLVEASGMWAQEDRRPTTKARWISLLSPPRGTLPAWFSRLRSLMGHSVRRHISSIEILRSLATKTW